MELKSLFCIECNHQADLQVLGIEFGVEEGKNVINFVVECPKCGKKSIMVAEVSFHDIYGEKYVEAVDAEQVIPAVRPALKSIPDDVDISDMKVNC